ncbi:MAG: DUF302 domain-containing protein [Alphaproteobacteria bacterium]|nr:DUF302 domain-containing protein [Alphaproteobacteria bacterium]
MTLKTLFAAPTAVILILCAWLAAPALAQDEEFDNSVTYYSQEYKKPELPTGWLKMPSAPKRDWPDNTVQPQISAEAKMRAFQSMMMFNPMSLRQMIGMMVVKKKVKEGISFDEVVESMDLRANVLNMKKVGHNTPYKIVEGITGQPSSRHEIISYCDVPTMRMILDYVPEFAVFVPCRIAILEDANKDIWIMTMDWDVRWLDTSPNPNKISEELRGKAIEVRESIESIMEAGANGDL